MCIKETLQKERIRISHYEKDLDRMMQMEKQLRQQYLSLKTLCRKVEIGLHKAKKIKDPEVKNRWLNMYEKDLMQIRLPKTGHKQTDEEGLRTE